MNILVIGCGSIGQRHIRNLISLGMRKICAFDINQNKLKQVGRISSAIETSRNLYSLWKHNPRITIISVPTSLHVKFALEAARRGSHLFIEKPLSHNTRNIDSLLKIIRKQKLIALVGCNMRFYWAINRIKNLLKKNMIKKVVSARIEAGQYLPDWHPWEDYRDMYSARKKLGGGIILDSIHEIDYARWFFGEVTDILGMCGKLSSLKIETEDTAGILLRFKNGPIVNMHLDYVQRIYGRTCKIIGEEGTIYWDFNEHAVKVFLARTKRWEIIEEPKNYQANQMYLDEMRYFMNCVKKRQATFNDITAGLKTLKIALSAKKPF